MPAFEPHAHPLLRRIESIATFALSDEEQAAVVGLPLLIQDLRADQDVVREGDRPSRSFVVLEGFASTYKMSHEGKRQIMAFHVAGDVPDLQSLHLKTLDISIGTISPCKVGFITHEALREMFRLQPRLAQAFWRATLIDGAIFREWLLNVGQRDAYGRMAHLVCELVTRLKVMGLVEDGSCELPITQSEMGDALGITTVHVNRTLQQLRANGLITWTATKLTVPDWDGLCEAAGFDPLYLHLQPQAEAA